MKLKQVLSEKIGGYWDGGKKDTFYWEIGIRSGEDKKGKFVEVGSWEANHWFMVSEGKTEKKTLSNARQRLNAMANKSGLTCTFEYIN